MTKSDMLKTNCTGTNKFTTDDLKSGYVVAFRNGAHRMVMRAGNFTKILIGPSGWNYLSRWNSDNLTCKGFTHHDDNEQTLQGAARDWDIVKVYGLVTDKAFYSHARSVLSLAGRDLLWKRKESVKMTLKQIEEKLGYEILIVAEESYA